MSENLGPVAPVRFISERLAEIFPSGVDQRGYVTREIAAKTIFVMLYAGAIADAGRWIRPNQVTKMTDQQAAKTDAAARTQWYERSLQPAKGVEIRGRWYADNTREPIRDETIRYGLMKYGAVVERTGLPTTSQVPRYALATDFASLFTCSVDEFPAMAAAWQQNHLTAIEMARLAIVRRAASAGSGSDGILVTFPGGETRRMAPGESSIISQAVVEEFGRNFLREPALIFLSESRNKVVSRDNELAAAIGLRLAADELLPDIILVDLHRPPLLVFVEVVASDGPITAQRKDELTAIAAAGGFQKENLAFVTALLDKGGSTFRKVSSQIAWGTSVWFASEPNAIVLFHSPDKMPQSLSQLLRLNALE